MKKLILGLAVLSLVSCQKKKCWTCSVQPDEPLIGVPWNPQIETKCDFTDRGIEKYMEENRHVDQNGIMVSTYCSEKGK